MVKRPGFTEQIKMRAHRILSSIIFLFLILFGFRGIVFGQNIYSENFTGQDGKGASGTSAGTTTDLNGVDWTIDVGTTLETDASTNQFEVVSGVFSGIDVDGSAYWYSPIIDVSTYTAIDLKLDLKIIGNGANSSGENITVYYTKDPASGTPTYVEVSSYDQTNDSELPASLNELNIDVSSSSEFGIRIEIYANGAGDGFSFDNILVSKNTVKSEPASNISSFNATGLIKSIDLSWTDASGSPEPDAYLIKVSDVGYSSIANPTDSVSESDDTHLADGEGVLNVYQGNQSASLSGLNELTTYYFKIYSYTNSGSDIDYKTDGTIPKDSATTLETPDIVLNEFLADPDASYGDSNGDGIVSSDDDEFVEFVNTGSVDLDISSWTVEESGSTQHTFEDSTILKPLQAVVVFGGGSPAGNFGEALVQTTSSLSLSNSSGEITLNNESGLEVLSYTYGSEAGDNQSITRSPDLTGLYVKHSSASDTAFSPGTRINGSHFQPSTIITGDAGWRLLSLPIENGIVEDVSDDTAVQGIPGGAQTTADPNFLINPAYDGTNPSDYITPINTSTPWGDGLGFFLYFFNNSVNGSSPLPLTLEAFGNAPSSDVQVTLTDLWTLAGNPFNSNLSIDEISGNDNGQGINDGLVSPIYVYDSSGWKTVNFGNANVIDDWTGFFVQRYSSNTTLLTLPVSAITTDSVKLSKHKSDEKFRQVDLWLEAPQNKSDRTSKLYFSDHSTFERDGFDGGKLSSLTGSPLLALVNDFGNGKEYLVQDARSMNPEKKQFYELAFADAGISGTYTVSWPRMINIPEDWILTFIDYDTGKSTRMLPGDFYTFNVEARGKERNTSAPELGFSSLKIKAEDYKLRFGITLKTGSATSNESFQKPQTVVLKQNYPNPFNPITSIEYSITEYGPVTLTIYNVMGQRVMTLVDDRKAPGIYRLRWDANGIASGIYYYQLRVGRKVITKKLTLIK